MFFRNLTFFRFPATLSLDGLEAQLTDAALKPVGPQELASQGFVSPYGRTPPGHEPPALHNRIGDAIWLTVGGERRILPGAVVNELLAKKLAAIEEAEGRKLGGRARKQLKEDLVNELLPKAFVRSSRVDAVIDVARGVLMVNTASRKAGESVVNELRRAIGSFPALPINAEVAPRSVLTAWVAGDPLPDGLSIGDEAQLEDPMEGGAVARLTRQEMQSDEIAKHLEASKQVTRLGLTLSDHLSFVLGEDLVIRKLRFLDGAVDKLEGAENDDRLAELNARFALMAGEVAVLFDLLEAQLRLSSVNP